MPTSAYALLIAIALVTVLLRALLLHGRAAPIAAPGSIMAVGIFGLAALQHLPGLSQAVTRPLALALLVIWGHLAASFAGAAATGALAADVGPPVGRFAIGTWVAGTAVVAGLLVRALPGWGGLAVLLGCLACAIWGWFIALSLAGFRAIAAAPGEARANGAILLSTVSTQSIAFLALGLFPDVSAVRSAAAVLIVLGYLLYAVGAALVLRRYHRQRGWTLAEDWENANCILHGAMSITGLVAVTSGILPYAVCYATWLYVAAMFLLVEGIELARLTRRLRAYGWRRGVWTYDVSQWSRNFTFGMFYAFTLAFAGRFAAQTPPTAAAVQAAILDWGAYLVLALLLVEIALFASAQITPRDRAAAGAAKPPKGG